MLARHQLGAHTGVWSTLRLQHTHPKGPAAPMESLGKSVWAAPAHHSQHCLLLEQEGEHIHSGHSWPLPPTGDKSFLLLPEGWLKFMLECKFPLTAKVSEHQEIIQSMSFMSWKICYFHPHNWRHYFKKVFKCLNLILHVSKKKKKRNPQETLPSPSSSMNLPRCLLEFFDG